MHEARLSADKVDYTSRLRELVGFDPRYDILETYGRFNLAVDARITQDLLINDREDQQVIYRILVTPVDGDSEAISVALDDADIPQLEEIASNDTLKAYNVPFNAKPLLNERLFPDRESSDTYISDEETFNNLGLMWHMIYKTTGKLPSNMVMARTGMKEFSSDQLFPIPPYNDWKKVRDDEQALAMFSGSMLDELKSIYPNTDDTQLQVLCGAAVKGFAGK